MISTEDDVAALLAEVRRLRGETAQAEHRGRVAGLREAGEVCRKMAVTEHEKGCEADEEFVLLHDVAGGALTDAQVAIRKLIEEATDD